MANSNAQLKKEPDILDQVPQKIKSDELEKFTLLLNKNIKEMKNAVAYLENAVAYLEKEYGVTGESAVYLIGFLAGAKDAHHYFRIAPFEVKKDGKNLLLGVSEFLADREIADSVYTIQKMAKTLKELEKFFDETSKITGEEGYKLRKKPEYNQCYYYFTLLRTIIIELFNDGYKHGRYDIVVEDEAKRKKQPELKEELIKLPPTATNILMYGSSPIYYDKQTRITGPKEQIMLIRKAAAKKEIEGDEELLFYLIPLIGAGYAVLKDLEMIKEGSEEKLKLWKFNLSEKDIGKAMLVLDVVVGWYDLNFIIHLGTKAAIKTAAREIPLLETKGSRKIVISQIEKDIVEKAVKELDEKNMKAFLEIIGGDPKKVSKELIEKAGSVNNITKEILENYIKQAKKIKIGIGKKTAALLFRKKFKEYAPLIFFNELANNIEFSSVRFLGQTAEKLGEKEKRIALETIFATFSTLDKSAQKALGEYVKKNGWEKVIEVIKNKKNVVEALQELLPAYKFAFKYAPFEEVLKTAAQLGSAHAVFTFVQMLGDYISEKKEKELRVDKFLQSLNTTLKFESKDEALNAFIKGYEKK